MIINECHVILDQSQRRISYVHLCKNTNSHYMILSIILLIACKTEIGLKLPGIFPFDNLARNLVNTSGFVA